MSTIDTIYNLKDVLYSILFVAGDGIEKSFIAEKLQVSQKSLTRQLQSLKKSSLATKGCI